MSELKRCPFCGGEAEIRLGGMIYIPRCTKCGCELAGCREREEVIESWNTRKPMDKIVERLKEKALGGMGCPQWLPLESALEIIEEEGGA